MTKAPDPADKVLDAAADGQFQRTAPRRAGDGSVTLDGVTYTRLEWILRAARKGETLAAGEGKVLADEIDRLREVQQQADDGLRDRLAAAQRDVERMDWLADAPICDGFVNIPMDLWEWSSVIAEQHGRMEWTTDDQREAFRRMVDTAFTPQEER